MLIWARGNDYGSHWWKNKVKTKRKKEKSYLNLARGGIEATQNKSLKNKNYKKKKRRGGFQSAEKDNEKPTKVKN